MSAGQLTTRILAFDFDLCFCDGEGFFDLFVQLLALYEYTKLNSEQLPPAFVSCVENTYKQLLLETVASSRKGKLFLFRPGLDTVLRTVQQMKKDGKLQYVMFYSNNTCPEFLSFVELATRLSFPGLFTAKKPVIELVFTANTASRMKVEYAPLAEPNAREKSIKGILTCLEDLDLPVSPNPEVLFFDDMEHSALGGALRVVPEYKAIHTAENIYDVFFTAFENSGLYENGAISKKWRGIDIHNMFMKNDAAYFLAFLKRRDLPATINEGAIQKEKTVCGILANEIRRFCHVAELDALAGKTKRAATNRDRKAGRRGRVKNLRD